MPPVNKMARKRRPKMHTLETNPNRRGDHGNTLKKNRRSRQECIRKREAISINEGKMSGKDVRESKSIYSIIIATPIFIRLKAPLLHKLIGTPILPTSRLRRRLMRNKSRHLDPGKPILLPHRLLAITPRRRMRERNIVQIVVLRERAAVET